jgi:uncharacterized protein
LEWQRDLAGFVAGFLIATITSPVGVSGAVFLMPVQMSLLGVPSPQVTPTNLLYNLVSGPGALVGYARLRQFRGSLTWLLVLGSAPGVIVGAVLRVYVVDDPALFRLVAAAVLLPTGAFILHSTHRRAASRPRAPWRPRLITSAAFVVGVLGGMYGIGGGSILGPILVGSGLALSRVAPAALASTFVTSVVGVIAFALLGLHAPERPIAPDWSLGLMCGIGGLVGGFLGASLQPRLPERHLRTGLGLAAVGLAVFYSVQALL